MSIANWSKTRITPSGYTIADSFFENGSLYNPSSTSKFPPVNVKENVSEFTLDVVAPGCKRENLQILIEDRLLVIHSGKFKKLEGTNENYSRSKYSYWSLSRQFAIPLNVDVNNIKAKYMNGILSLTLPKSVKVPKEVSKTIEIAK